MSCLQKNLVRGTQGWERKEEGKEDSGNEAENGEIEKSDVISSMHTGGQTRQWLQMSIFRPRTCKNYYLSVCGINLRTTTPRNIFGTLLVHAMWQKLEGLCWWSLSESVNMCHYSSGRCASGMRPKVKQEDLAKPHWRQWCGKGGHWPPQER